MDHDAKESECAKLNIQSVSENQIPAFDKKTLAQLNDEFNESIKIDKISGDIVIDLSPIFRSRDSEEFNREMTVLKQIAKRKKLHDLFDHPLPRLFLNLKWNKAAKVFYLNLLILFVFIIAMIGYMIYYHSIISDMLREKSFGLLFLKLICHLSISSLMEAALIYYGLEAFFLPEKIDIPSRKFRHVILILLCTCELLNILSKIPLASLSTYIEILKRVLQTFMKVLILYSLVIVAFATSFHILFVRSDAKLDGEEYFHTFQTLPIALLRTIVMMTGEFDADDLKLNSINTGIIFLLFLIVCTIILLNLLNALAISDTQQIIDEGKRFERIQRVRMLYFYEKCLRNLINRQKCLFFRIPNSFKRFERFLGREMYNRIFNIWPQSSNSCTIIIRTARNNQILVLESDGKEIEIQNPNFVFRKFIPSFPKIFNEFKTTIFEFETVSEEIVDSINEITKEEETVTNEAVVKQLLTEMKLLKKEIEIMKTFLERQRKTNTEDFQSSDTYSTDHIS